jgi:hypothetical protein
VKPDDASLPPSSERVVRKYADLLLKKADAYGRFPTPVADIVVAARLEIARESALSRVGLDGVYRTLPNALKLAPDKIKRAASKVLGLLDRRDRAIHLDPSAHPKKKIYITMHEVGHEFLPHQRETYALLEDSESELDPETNDLYEREANCFASEVLFQLDTFRDEAADSGLSVKVPLDLSKKYGPSVYASFRRYVAQHHEACALVVYDPVCTGDDGLQVMHLRRTVYSPSFEAQFGRLAWPEICCQDDFFFAHRPIHRFTPPTLLRLKDRNGVARVSIVEAFDSTHHLLFLVYPTASTVTL